VADPRLLGHINKIDRQDCGSSFDAPPERAGKGYNRKSVSSECCLISLEIELVLQPQATPMQPRSRASQGRCRGPHPPVRPGRLVVGTNGKGRTERAAEAPVFAHLDCAQQRSHHRDPAPGHQEALGHRYRLFHCGTKTPVSHRHGRPSPPPAQRSRPSPAEVGRSRRPRLARRCHPSGRLRRRSRSWSLLC
jgi:hypothetical protein